LKRGAQTRLGQIGPPIEKTKLWTCIVYWNYGGQPRERYAHIEKEKGHTGNSPAVGGSERASDAACPLQQSRLLPHPWWGKISGEPTFPNLDFHADLHGNSARPGSLLWTKRCGSVVQPRGSRAKQKCKHHVIVRLWYKLVVQTRNLFRTPSKCQGILFKEPNPYAGSRPRDIIGLYRKHCAKEFYLKNPTPLASSARREGRHWEAGVLSRRLVVQVGDARRRLDFASLVCTRSRVSSANKASPPPPPPPPPHTRSRRLRHCRRGGPGQRRRRCGSRWSSQIRFSTCMKSQEDRTFLQGC